MQAVLQLLGAVEEEALFRLCDLVVDQDTAGALTFVEELAAQGQDLGRLVLDLLEHLRALMLVQHMGEVPDSLPLTDETRERLAAQANQLGAATVVRLIDLLAVAVEDMRQGGDPRLPLELALVKVTRPAADMSREAIAYRLDQLERGRSAPVPGTSPRDSAGADSRRPRATPTSSSSSCRRRGSAASSPAVSEKSIPTASMLAEARPAALDDDTLTIEFPQTASFHRKLAEEPKNATLLRDALYELTGRRLALEFVLGEGDARGGAGGRGAGGRGGDLPARQGNLRREGDRPNEHGLQQARAAGAADAGADAEGAGGDGERDRRGNRGRRRRHGEGDGHRERSPRSRSRRRRSIPTIPETLEDLVLAAVNSALQAAEELAKSKLNLGALGDLGSLGLGF